MSFLLDEMGLDKMGLDEMGWHPINSPAELKSGSVRLMKDWFNAVLTSRHDWKVKVKVKVKL